MKIKGVTITLVLPPIKLTSIPPPVMGKKGLPHKTPFRGLWFIGAQSESGAGMKNVIEGVWRTITMMEKE